MNQFEFEKGPWCYSGRDLERIHDFLVVLSEDGKSDVIRSLASECANWYWDTQQDAGLTMEQFISSFHLKSNWYLVMERAFDLWMEEVKDDEEFDTDIDIEGFIPSYSCAALTRELKTNKERRENPLVLTQDVDLNTVE